MDGINCVFSQVWREEGGGRGRGEDKRIKFEEER